MTSTRAIKWVFFSVSLDLDQHVSASMDRWTDRKHKAAVSLGGAMVLPGRPCPSGPSFSGIRAMIPRSGLRRLVCSLAVADSFSDDPKENAGSYSIRRSFPVLLICRTVVKCSKHIVTRLRSYLARLGGLTTQGNTPCSCVEVDRFVACAGPDSNRRTPTRQRPKRCAVGLAWLPAPVVS